MNWLTLTLVKGGQPTMLNLTNAVGILAGPAGRGSLISFNSATKPPVHVEETMEVIDEMLKEL